MSQFQIENRYAKAALAWMSEQKCEEQSLANMKSILAIKQKQTEIFFQRHAGKQSLLLETTKTLVPNLSEESKKFLRFLLVKKRLHLIFGIARQFVDLCKEKSGIKTAKLVTAKKNVGDAFIKNIQALLKKRDGSNYQLQQSSNPNLLGGFQVIIKNTVLDYSVAGKLETLKKTMEKEI